MTAPLFTSPFAIGIVGVAIGNHLKSNSVDARLLFDKCLSGKKIILEAQDEKESVKRIPYEAEKQYVVYWIALVTGYVDEGLNSVVESLF